MMTTSSVAAADLHIGDRVLSPAGTIRRITLHRLQGAEPTVILALDGLPGHRKIPAWERLRVVTDMP